MNTFKIKVQTNSSKRKIVEVNHPKYEYKVYVNASPEKGKANKEVVELIADYLSVSKTSVLILSGTTSPVKLVKVVE